MYFKIKYDCENNINHTNIKRFIRYINVKVNNFYIKIENN